MSTSETPVLVEVANHVGHLTLNRPNSLNTLTLPMVRTMHQQLQAWEDDPEVHAVVLRAAGEKAFCAGGDIRAIYDSYKGDGSLHREFFEEEYALDLYLHNYGKPILALMHGIVLGGGMGLVQGADFRLVTETSRLGMPEVGIGFFPDVGAGYFLPRLPGELGTYLGVTGNHIHAADALYCGLADRYLSSADIPKLDASLGTADWSGNPAEVLRGLLDELTEDALPDASLAAVRPAIDEHFAQASVPDIYRALVAEDRSEYRDWAVNTAAVLESRSPTAMAVTLEHLRRGRTLSPSECFDQDLKLVQRFLDAGDFMEGVRALIVDKDKDPHWSPSRLEAVTADQVERFFQD